ncbi:hypothetical protein Q31a_17390 [Aureliella helgolandensis]|uniref:Uncharacterized protein n=1 Tax=Aureliella helgolandensis TaxID=2527968 RepID=A0A518G4C1_9BACT|nr:hypothetical protein Q31a_17390 [Aureliella helgolandensis]
MKVFLKAVIVLQHDTAKELSGSFRPARITPLVSSNPSSRNRLCQSQTQGGKGSGKCRNFGFPRDGPHLKSVLFRPWLAGFMCVSTIEPDHL